MLTLNYRDSRPIYEQIKDGLRKLIVTGAIAPDEKLPSVRSLAMELAINPNTIQRAYAELETEGFIYSVPGKGSFAQLQAESILQDARREAAEIMAKTLAEAQLWPSQSVLACFLLRQRPIPGLGLPLTFLGCPLGRPGN